MTGLMTGGVIVLSWEIGAGLRLPGKRALGSREITSCRRRLLKIVSLLRLIVSLLSSLFLVAVLNLVFGGVAVVKVRFSGSLSARSAIPNLVDTGQPPLSLSAPPLLLVFPSTTTKLQSSNVRFSLFSSWFLPFLVQAVPGILDLPFACFIGALPCFCLFFLF
jgi:hypothetical protein